MNVSIGKIAAAAIQLSDLPGVSIVRVTKTTVVLAVSLYSLRDLELRASRLLSKNVGDGGPRYIIDSLERAVDRLQGYVGQAMAGKHRRESQ